MNIALWIVAGFLALAFLAAGLTKVSQPKAKLVTMGMDWVESTSAGAVKALGLAEVLGALGLILPWATGIATVLTPIAAAALVIVMIGAVLTHAKRNEYNRVGANVALGVLALFVAVGRFAGWGA